MTIKAADLPDSLKRPLLGKIKDQIGGSQYDQMVGSMGEDGLLDILLSSTSEAPSSSATAVHYNQSAWAKGLEVVGEVLGSNTWIWVAMAFGMGWGGFVAVLGFFVLLYLGATFFEAIGALNAVSTGLAWVVGITVGGAAVVGIGYGLWIGVPWIVSGVGQWWGWLGGHFV